MDAWGKHLLVDAGGCDKDKIQSAHVIKQFIADLVKRIDMVPHGEPILEHFATHDPSKGGYTFCQMISTSLIDGHLVDETGEAYISVHSCKDFDHVEVINTIHDHFDPKTIKFSEHKRKA